MPPKRNAGEYTLRSGSSVVVFWIGASVMAILAATPVVRGDGRLFAFVVAPCLLVVWVLWIALYRPAVRYDERRAVVVNIGRTHVVPWSRVESVRQRIGLVFELEGGRVITAAGVPPPRRVGNVAGNFDRRTRPTNYFDTNSELLENVRVAAAPSADSVASKWDVVPLAIGAALVIAVVVETLVGI